MFRWIAFIFTLYLLTACSAPEATSTPAEAGLNTALTPTATHTAAPTVVVATPTATKVSQPSATPLPATATPTATAATATPTPTSTVTPTPILHQVQAGETFFSLALTYDTTVAALAEINQMAETDFLQIGQNLIIPPPPTPTPTTLTATVTTTLNVAAITQTLTATALSSPQTTTLPQQPLPAPTPMPSGPPIPNITHAPNINPLTGLPVTDLSVLQRRPILIRIGNDVGARQAQAGFNQADMVYEEVAEWWVTRFTAVFLSQTPKVVAPIRSARLINVQLAPQYQAGFAHSGGSDPVRWEISQATNMVNLDEFYNAAPYFYRPNQGWQTRLAVDVEAIRQYLQSQGTEAAVTLQGFNFAETIPGGQDAPNIFIPYPKSTSFTEWRYDTARGKYLRWILGAPLVDGNDGLQVSADNVVIYFAEHQATDIVEDSNGSTSIRVIVNGRGPAWFFRDGKLNKGFWQTDGTRTPYFSDEAGQPYALKPGNTWVEVVPTYYTIGLKNADEAQSK